ncbi:hypothetical protein ACMATS_37535 [Streptoverticillium reticulum]|uniref:hypothetical protein n=1 Tax=Streptoverticillium reticulum TaxID=1433415 RepID=UPI0039BFBE76
MRNREAAKNIRRRRNILFIGASMSGVLLLQGQASAAEGSYAQADLPNGQKLTLPYDLPDRASFYGFLPPGNGTGDASQKEASWGVTASNLNPRPFLSRYAVEEAVRNFLPSASSALGDAHVIIHDSLSEGSTYLRSTGQGIASYCAKNKTNCGFVGKLSETAPVMAQTGISQGPQTVSVTSSVTKTKTRQESSGYSIGASITGKLSGGGKDGAAGGGVDVSGSFTYSKMTTDINSTSTANSTTYTRTIPAGKWGYEQLRFTGGQYTGIAVAKINPRAMYLPLWKEKEAGNEWSSKGLCRGTTGRVEGKPWISGTIEPHPVLEVFPAKAVVKAPGNLPATTRNVVLTEDRN